METKVSKQDNATILHISGRLDSNTAPTFEKQIQDYLATQTSHLVFNCEELDYISSAGLRVMLNTAKAYKAGGQYQFFTCAMQDHVREIFELAGFDLFIAITPTVADCLNKLTNGGN